MLELSQKAIDLDPSDPSPYINKGYALMELGRLDEAEDTFKKYRELLPDAPNVYDCLGDLYMEMEDYGKAYESYMKANDLGWGDSKAIRAKEMMGIEEVVGEGEK